eukprot:CAMPEP_0185596582 /NCGR_PEP_ID=MMETSP0434-20130131/80836_1 /TAXON_ID=626734 ORGANISM="Favella taraikaensis, Strain Fe Narragansett Bay" /NCGR_SAMPLE_ID=MMETSP0434 /ASSEMBLY_ACC=CAM_ASM_000379 /LENGTH=438 /DNA_ID=CAMNT_0028225103 /DNA_START=2099 /DNA_END=3415 /DNA_ORIENTATION=-
MPNENGDNIKLAPILKEAYDLLWKLESIKLEADKKCRKLEQQKRKLKEKRENLAALTSVEDQAAHAKELFKTIMCPLQRNCPKHTSERWPKSEIPTTTQLGQDCPYAAPPNGAEVSLDADDEDQRNQQDANKYSGQTETKKAGAAFIPTGRIYDCKGGCYSVYKCNMCKYKQMAGTLITDLDHKPKFNPAEERMKKRCYAGMQRAEASETKNYIKEMDTIKKELKLDELYCKKFGLLKKASILAYYGREKDAKHTVATAATIVASNVSSTRRNRRPSSKDGNSNLALDDGFELPERANIKKKHPNDISDEDLAECELGPGTTLATVRLYIDKVSPYNNEAYNKNVFLDRLIEDLYISCEAKKMKKHSDIEKMKKHIEGLEEIAELAEQFGEEGVEENLLDDEGEGVKFKPRKTKMCPEILAKRKCKNGKACKLAHNPI